MSGVSLIRSVRAEHLQSVYGADTVSKSDGVNRAQLGRLASADAEPLVALRESALETTYVSIGNRRTASPHEFYRYPARFPPAFARAAIDAFTSVGDLVVDPFVGGGTSLVEARLSGRPAIGSDLNHLAVFVSKVKSRPLRGDALDAVERWAAGLSHQLRGARTPPGLNEWVEAGYLRNVDDTELRPVRRVLAKVLETLDSIDNGPARDLARCAILRTGQWALDMRGDVPQASQIVDVVNNVALAMALASREYARNVRRADALYELTDLSRKTQVLAQRVPGLAARLSSLRAPRLVLTSPPYPGVYVNYHRWKVRGRRETPAPFWLANRQDGNGLAYYTMSARADRTLSAYFRQLEAAFADVGKLCDENTIIVQMVGFHDPAKDLPRYLAAMNAAGFAEARLPEIATADDGRLWRRVPNRRWWATNASEIQTASEVVLLHQLQGS